MNITRNAIAAAVAAVLPLTPLRSQSPVPVNLFVADLTYERGSIRVGTPRKLTGDRGVSSQPAFTPDGKSILFVSRRDSANAQSDIYRIDLATGIETRVTATPEMENSPTVTPDGKLMVIRWTPATLFREWGPWIYEMDGRPLKGVLPGPDTVGYYVRVDSVTFAMVRPKSRPAVAVFDVRTGTMRDHDWPVANLPPQLVPGRRAVSYTRPDSAGRNEIRSLDLASGETSRVAPALLGRTVHVWTPRGSLLMGKGNRIYALDPSGDSVWRAVATFTDPALQSVTTYVISPRGDKVIIISPARPALHAVIRDSLQAGRTMAEALRSVRGRTGTAPEATFEIAEGPLLSLTSEQATRGSAVAAVELLEFLAALLPRSYAVHLELGSAYRKAGDESRAIASFRRSLTLNPRTSDAEKRAAERAEQSVADPSRK